MSESLPGDRVEELEAAGRVRRFLVHRPPQGDGGPLPLVVMLHGAGATGELARRNTGWAELADRAGFLAVFPEGTPPDPARPPMFRQNPQTWNDGSGRGHVARAGIDDVGFLAALLDDLAERYPIDSRQIFLSGFSNGASLAFRAGIELADRITAIGPVGGHLWLEPDRLTAPVSLCHLMGGRDPLNPPDGGEVATPWGRTEHHPPAERSTRRWARALGCDDAPVATRVGELTTADYRDCRSGARVRFGLIHDLGHVWPGGARLLPEGIVGPASRAVLGADYLWGFFTAVPVR